MAAPYIDEKGQLRIPKDAPEKYQWWTEKGQSAWETAIELGVPKEKLKEAVLDYYRRLKVPDGKWAVIDIDLKTKKVVFRRNFKLPEDLEEQPAAGEQIQQRKSA